MNTVYFLILLGILIGSFIGLSKYKSVNAHFKREPNRAFPEEWRTILRERVDFYNKLNATRQKDFERRVHIFLLNVQLVGIDTEVTHEDRILVAAGAIIPIFGFEKWHYANVKVVEIHPDQFLIPTTNKMATGLVGWGAMEGRVMLSRKAIYEGFYNQNDHKNLVVHEFIHILDKQDGKVDGVLENVMQEIDITPWLNIIHHSMRDIEGGNSSIRAYGKTNNAEFLAVVGEYFFESPEKMKSEHPKLYRALDNFFNPKKKIFARSTNGYRK